MFCTFLNMIVHLIDSVWSTWFLFQWYIYQNLQVIYDFTIFEGWGYSEQRTFYMSLSTLGWQNITNVVNELHGLQLCHIWRLEVTQKKRRSLHVSLRNLEILHEILGHCGHFNPWPAFVAYIMRCALLRAWLFERDSKITSPLINRDSCCIISVTTLRTKCQALLRKL